VDRNDYAAKIARFASTSREYCARSLGAMIQEKIGANAKLTTMTPGKRSGACFARLGIESTATAPIPKSTELTNIVSKTAIENLVDIVFDLRNLESIHAEERFLHQIAAAQLQLNRIQLAGCITQNDGRTGHETLRFASRSFFYVLWKRGNGTAITAFLVDREKSTRMETP
jgi:hypothetical protein